MAATGDSSVLVEREGDVLWLTLNRPQKRNAVDASMRKALVEAFAGSAESGARSIVLQGAGEGFCAGADLSTAGPGERRPGVAVFEGMQRNTQALVTAVRDCPLPVVASVHGAAAGVGMSLVLASDVVVVADDARLLAAQMLRAIVPDGGLGFLLPELIGMSRAKRVLLTGGTIPAQECLDLGIAAELTPPGDRREATRRWAEDLAARPTKVISYAKSMLNRSRTTDWETFLLLERAGQGLMSTTEDAREGIAAFKEKRDPDYRNS